MRSVLAAILLASSLWPLTGCAQAAREPAPPLRVATQSLSAEEDRALRSKVIALLDAEDHDQELSQLGPESIRLLQQIFNTPANRPARRLRAIEALGRVQGAEASDELRAILKEKAVSAQYRSAAAVALARREGKAAVEELRAYLGDPSTELRVGAARALGYIGGPDARAAVEDRVAKETDAKVREELQQIITRMNP
jgi:HEAT repeat protein